MKDPIDGQWLKNITCPSCRHRHPAAWTCAYASALADGQKAERMEIDDAYKINGDQTVAVSNEVFWNDDMDSCPRGVKVQLLGAGGVALYGTYDGKDKFYTSWAPVPRRSNKS